MVSDVLYDAIEAIKEYQQQGIIASFACPQLTFVLAVMRAEQRERDQSPGLPSRFEADLAVALEHYRSRSGNRILTCQACGVQFSSTKIDRVTPLEDEIYCSQDCATEGGGWYDTGDEDEDTTERTS